MRRARSLALAFLFQPDAGAAIILGNELDASLFKRALPGKRSLMCCPDDGEITVRGLKCGDPLRTTVSFIESNYNEGKNRVKGAVRTLYRSRPHTRVRRRPGTLR